MDRTTELDLLNMGEQCCASDFAVANYLLPWHPQFFGCSKKLVSSLRRAAAQGPKHERAYRLHRIDEVLAACPDEAGNPGQSILREEIIENEERIHRALLQLNDADLEILLRNAAQRIDTGSADDMDFWMEDNGFTFNTDGLDDDDAEVMQCRPGALRNTLTKNVRKKHRHSHIAQLAEGLVLLLDEYPTYVSMDRRITLRYGEIADFLEEFMPIASNLAYGADNPCE